MKRFLLPALVLLLARTGMSETLSEPLAIDTAPDESLLWKTMRSNAARLWWNLPSTADSARLTFVGIKHATVVPLAAGETEYLWTPTPLTDAKDEDVYTVRLEFLQGGAVIADETLEAAGIARIQGKNAATGTRVIADGAENPKWERATDGKAVLPLWDVSTTSLTVDGLSVPLPGLPGWLGVCVPIGETRDLEVTTGDGTVQAQLKGVASGLLLILR